MPTQCSKEKVWFYKCSHILWNSQYGQFVQDKCYCILGGVEKRKSDSVLPWMFWRRLHRRGATVRKSKGRFDFNLIISTCMPYLPPNAYMHCIYMHLHENNKETAFRVCKRKLFKQVAFIVFVIVFLLLMLMSRLLSTVNKCLEGHMIRITFWWCL